jgi:hypothetical protein
MPRFGWCPFRLGLPGVSPVSAGMMRRGHEMERRWRQVRNELLRFSVVSLDFSVRGKTWFSTFGKKSPAFPYDPDVRPSSTARLENVMSAVWSPTAATFPILTHVPTAKQRMKIAPVPRDFPERMGAGFWLPLRKSQPLSVRRPLNPERPIRDSHQCA